MDDVSSRAMPLEDEELLEVVQRTLREVVLPYLERTSAEEFVLSQVRSCLSILGFAVRGLEERQRARIEADRELLECFERRPRESSWTSATPAETGRYIACARQDDAEGSDPDGLAREVRALLVRRLRAELRTRAGTPDLSDPNDGG